MKTLLIAISIIFIMILIFTAVYLTWENRSSNQILFKVYSFLTIGLVTIILTILLQDKKKDIKYETTTMLIVDKKGMPLRIYEEIDKKDYFIDRIVSQISSKFEENENENEKFLNNTIYLDILTKAFINFLEKHYASNWKIEYKYNELTRDSSISTHIEKNVTTVNTSKIDFYRDNDFNNLAVGSRANQIIFPKNTKVKFIKNNSSNSIILENKYFDFEINIHSTGMDGSLNQLAEKTNIKLLQGHVHTYYFNINTLCKFNEFYTNNPLSDEYELWIKNMNKLINQNFNSLESIKKYKKENKEFVSYYNYKNLYQIEN